MERIIRDEANNVNLNLINVEIKPGFDQGLYGDYYLTVVVNYMDPTNTTGTWIEVAKFMHASENPHTPESAKSPISKEKAMKSAKAFANELAQELAVVVVTPELA